MKIIKVKYNNSGEAIDAKILECSKASHDARIKLSAATPQPPFMKLSEFKKSKLIPVGLVEKLFPPKKEK